MKDAESSGDLPHANCYRVPGTRLIAGEYPGHRDPEAARAKVRALVDAGVTCFIDLTEERELAPYAHLVEDATVEAAEAAGARVEHQRLAVRDMGVPRSPAEMARILDAIDAALASDHTVYVHCWGGVGRTGTVVGCWLVRRGATGEEALREVARLFATTSAEKRGRHPEGSPQTPAQRAFVRGWREGAARAHTAPDAGTTIRYRVRGALVGLAVGDAVGTTVEFRRPGTFAPVTGMAGGGPFDLAPGEWTDDTSMALCLAESLIERGGMDAADQMRRYVRWWRDGHLSSTGRCFDIGNTTRGALAAFERTGDPLSGPTAPDTAGNGSLMRLAPVAMFFAGRPAQVIAAAAESSRTTHGAVVAIDACRYLAALLVGAFSGVDKEALLSPGFSPVPGYWGAHPLCPEIAAVADGSFRRKAPPEIRGTGYAAESLEAALWAFATTDSFRDGCLRAVNLGDDADTTGAVYGQLAGAFYGERGIPLEWRAKLALWPVLDEYAERLYDLGGSAAG